MAEEDVERVRCPGCKQMRPLYELCGVEIEYDPQSAPMMLCDACRALRSCTTATCCLSSTSSRLARAIGRGSSARSPTSGRRMEWRMDGQRYGKDRLSSPPSIR